MPPKTPKRRAEALAVAAFIERLYEASGFTSWGELARAAGVSAATMSDYKRGENAPSGYRLLQIMAAAGVPFSLAREPDESETEDDLLERASALLREVRRRRHHGNHPPNPQRAKAVKR
jgi:transcriptional regulator with XRE-family HTH domain